MSAAARSAPRRASTRRSSTRGCLLCHAAGLSHEAYVASAREVLFSPRRCARFDEAIARRLKREPVARITGAREFYGRSFRLGPQALDPRPDTETLDRGGARLWSSGSGWRDRTLRLLDLGTGTGCILVTLLAELPCARGLGTDLSPERSGPCRRQCEAPRRRGSRAAFVAADWLDGDRGQVRPDPRPTRLTSPRARSRGWPQEVAAYDPRCLRLMAAPTGLTPIAASPPRAGEVLAEDGRLLVEIGAGPRRGRGRDLRAPPGSSSTRPKPSGCDLAGRPRVVVARL